MTTLSTPPPMVPPTPDAPARPRRLSAAAILAKLGPLIGLVFVYLLFTVLTPMLTSFKFATMDNLELIFRQTVVVGIASLGMTMIIISGGIDLSVGAVLALGVVAVAWVLDRSHGQNVVGAAAAGIAASLLCGM